MSGILSDSDQLLTLPAQVSPRYLTDLQVTMIDEAIGSLGEYGELRLVIEKGRLRFVITYKSFDVLKYTPGMIAGKSG